MGASATARPAPSGKGKQTAMSDVVFILLTLAVFALLGLLVKGLEKL